jgi:hypothetical protein
VQKEEKKKEREVRRPSYSFSSEFKVLRSDITYAIFQPWSSLDKSKKKRQKKRISYH